MIGRDRGRYSTLTSHLHMFEVISSKSVLKPEGDSVRVGCPLLVMDNAVIVSHRHMKLLYAKKKNLVLG